MVAQVKAQSGRFFPGFLVGLLIGLLLALGVALYVSKVPTPFVNKVPGHSAEQDAADAARARNWDPNAPLLSGGKADARVGSGGIGTEPAAVPKADPATPSAGSGATDSSAARAAELLGGSTTPGAQPDTAVSAKPGAAPLQYYVQIGAYTRSEDAEQHRAKLAMSGLSARVTERDQGGRTMYRVRLGPFSVREDAENARDQAATSGYPDATLMPVQR